MSPFNNPLPTNLGAECRKAARILTSFVDPKQSFGPDKIIPPSVLANAKGLAVLTVVKAGFLVTARGGSGLVVARKPDGTWSAPSAIGTAGAGFGGQLGAEITDFVMILNDTNAVKTFAQTGSISLGGNVSIAAGPVGRNAEASGNASLRSVAAVFSYSKTKGLFAGVSLEGSVIVERKDANAKFYGGQVSAKQLLSGTVTPPREADVLLRILGSRVFSGHADPYRTPTDELYNDIPQYDNRRDDFIWQNREGEAYGEGQTRRGSVGGIPSSPGGAGAFGTRAQTWQSGGREENDSTSNRFQRQHFNSSYSDNPTSPVAEKTAPARPTAPKPAFKPRSNTLGANQAVALYAFEATQDGDLGFKKGDVITITKRSESKNDWWTGQLNGRTGIFPSNYVETV